MQRYGTTKDLSQQPQSESILSGGGQVENGGLWGGGQRVDVVESTGLISSVILRTPFPPPQAGGQWSLWLHLYIVVNLLSMTPLQTNQYAFNIHLLPCIAITLLPSHKWSYNAVVGRIELWEQLLDLIMN